MTGLPNIILPSDLVGQPRSHNAPPSRSPNSSFNSQRADPCTESSSSLATTSSFPYSNTFDMRHGYSPYLVPRRANSSIGQSSSRDPFSYEDSTPFFVSFPSVSTLHTSPLTLLCAQHFRSPTQSVRPSIIHQRPRVLYYTTRRL